MPTQHRQVVAKLARSKLRSDLKAVLLEVGISPEDVDARIDHAHKVADLCRAAHLDGRALSYVESHTSIDVVREKLLEAVEDDPKAQVRSYFRRGLT